MNKVPSGCNIRPFIGDRPIADYEFVSRAIPKWADLQQIITIYQKRNYFNNIWGTKFEVDHCIPIRGNGVCRLHVFENLQLLDSNLNERKGNRYWVDQQQTTGQV